MRNNIFLIDFPKKLELDKYVSLYYNLEYRKASISEYVLCRAQSIIVYSNDSSFDGNNYNFFNKIYAVNDVFLEKMLESPVSMLDKLVGRERLVNPRQFEIIKGSIVRSVIDNRLGSGVVLKKDESMVVVNFPKAKGYYTNPTMKCHESNLRVVAHIEEVSHGK